MRLADVTVYPQLRAYPGDDGYVDRYYNCGPASVCTVLRYCLGGTWSPDQVRDEIYGEGSRGYTYTGDLANYLIRRGVPAQWTYYRWDRARQAILEQVREGRLTICLFYFDLGNQSGGHFCVVYGADEERVWLVNPFGAAPYMGWSGFREVWSWEKFARGFKGWLILPQRGHRSGIRQYMTRVRVRPLEAFAWANVRSRPRLSARVVAKLRRGESALCTRWTPDGDAYRRTQVWRYAPALRGWLSAGATEKVE